MKVTFKREENITETKVICDTNVWYGFNQGNPTEIKEGFTLTPTSLTIAELATSEVMIYDLELYQKTIKAIYEKGGATFPLDPIDYVLVSQDPKYPVQEGNVEKILKAFSYVLSLELEQEFKFDVI